MGWLTDLTNWLVEQIQRIWDAVTEFFGDLIVASIEAVLDLFATIVEAIPVPDFIGNYSIGGLLSNVGSDLMWIMGAFRIGEGIALLGAGYAFRLMRKLLTLGQW